MHLQVTESSVDWINLARNSDKWPDLVNAVFKFPVVENEGNILNS